MSKIVQPSKISKGGLSKSATDKKPSALPSKSSIRKDTTLPAKKKAEWALPAFSVLPKKPKETINWEDLKKKTIRRLAPEGEDSKSIKNILKEIHGQTIPIHDFINMVSPYTSDNGAVLRQILEEDITTFRKLARKVYDTQTQDVSDVLVNEQLQLVNFYQEREDIYSEKMMNAINEIYEMSPNFDFERFMRDRDDYLNMLMPLPAEITRAPEELEMQRRQMAYHRLQWLRSEGERMYEENKRLQLRLEQLKSEQRDEQDRMAGIAAKAEEERQRLAVQEAEMKNKIQELNENVEQSIIENEAQITETHRATAMETTTGAVKKTTTGGQPKIEKRRKKKPEWVSEIAADIEEQGIREVLAVEAQAAAEAEPSSSRKRLLRRPVTSQKPAVEPRQTSPFHFSPDRAYNVQPQPQQEDVHVESYATKIQERRIPVRAGSSRAGPSQAGPPETDPSQTGSSKPGAQQRRGIPQPKYKSSRGQAPRDTWGGFH